eukprot:scaffold47_cov258-Pinguiococcus_pyrenoidosus.AAC.120
MERARHQESFVSFARISNRRKRAAGFFSLVSIFHVRCLRTSVAEIFALQRLQRLTSRIFSFLPDQ